ncbi:MAG TPA: phosphoenolpyruvate--protein phosphotransferase [Candidatus Polarisedimenticolia bacterium]|nr:phosphoenolpyruvate--protein phosphotransferase [Candidatus Polarisedimenticolia bacterium]
MSDMGDAQHRGGSEGAAPSRSASRVVRGIGVSPGISIAPCLALEASESTVFRVAVKPAEVASEVARFRKAVETAKAQLRELKQVFEEEHRETAGSIFEAQMLVLEDERLMGGTEEAIRRQKINAEWALRMELHHLTQSFADVPERERLLENIEDIEARIQKILAGGDHHDLSELTEDVIIVAPKLTPSETALLRVPHVVGLATDKGGPSSHTAIVAKALGIPAVVGLHDLSRRLASGDTAVVDGSRGLVLVNPAPAELARYRGMLDEFRRGEEQRLLALRDVTAETLDGRRVAIHANIELREQLGSVIKYGAEGIGLYRSEFLFLHRSPYLPTEQDHFEAYREMAEKLAPRVVTVRTLDLGGEKYFHTVLKKDENNPVLGMRAIRFCLAHKEIFKTQLRGILRASAHGNVRVMFPLISGVEEFRMARAVLSEAMEELASEGIPFKADIPVGLMIEVPSAAAVADLLAREADFFSIGTNDLIQYTLAIDRSNESVNYLYRPMHPAILRTIKFTVDAGRAAGIPVAMCGEMASDPLIVPILLGLGLSELSMDAVYIPSVKAAIRALSLVEAEAMAREVLKLPTATDVEQYAALTILPRLKQAVPLLVEGSGTWTM